MTYYVGVDLGQARDFTAVAIAERIAIGELRNGRDVELPNPPPYNLHIRHLERFRHAPYPEVCDRLESLLSRLTRSYDLAVDSTGVGLAVTDLLRDRGLRFRAVTITGGDKETSEGRNHRLPKRDLIAGLQVLLQSGRLKIAADLEHAETLRNELLNFRVKISASGHDSYEAWREAAHDDLVLAAALCSWVAARGGGVVDSSLAGTFGDPISDADLYRFDDSPAPRSEWDQDHDIFPSDPYAGGDAM